MTSRLGIVETTVWRKSRASCTSLSRRLRSVMSTPVMRNSRRSSSGGSAHVHAISSRRPGPRHPVVVVLAELLAGDDPLDALAHLVGVGGWT